jgi:hypothetical protein
MFRQRWRASGPRMSLCRRSTSGAIRSFSHGPKRRCRPEVVLPAERREESRDPGDRLDLDARCLADVPLEPPNAHASRARPVAERDEDDELERVAEVDLAALAQRELGRYDVAALDRPIEDRARVPVVARRPFPGPGGATSLAAAGTWREDAAPVETEAPFRLKLRESPLTRGDDLVTRVELHRVRSHAIHV